MAALAIQLAESGERRDLPGCAMGFRPKGYIDHTPHLGALATLRGAVDRRQICRVSYQARGRRDKTVYRYAPGRVVAMGGVLYVQGFRLDDGSPLRDRPTTFLLHRIAEVATTGEYFSFNADDTDVRVFGLSWHEPRRVSVQADPTVADYIRDRVWSDDQSITDHPDGSLTLTFTTTNEKEVADWVGSFLGAAKIFSNQEE